MIYSIQYLRALASLMVLIAHIRVKSSQYGANVFSGFQLGYFGVDLFFVISGFVMCFIYSRSRAGFSELKPFWVRRFNRILPLYWLLTVVALVAYLVAPSKVNSSGGETSIWRSFLLLPGGGKFLIENGWTLSYEFYFYALFSLSFFFVRKRVGAAIVGTVIVLAASCGLIFGNKDSFLTNAILVEFVYGMVVYNLYEASKEKILPIAGALCFVVSIFAFFHLNFSSSIFNYRWVTAGIPSALLLYSFLCAERWVRLRPSRVGVALGDSSYSLYLVHPFLLAAAGIIYKKFEMQRFGVVIEVGYWTLMLCLTLVVGYVVHRLVEMPLIRIAQRTTSTGDKRKPPLGQ